MTLGRSKRPETPTIEQVTSYVLDELAKMFDTYIVFPSDEHRDAVVLWTAHTHVYEAFDTTPRLSVFSVEPGSGKTMVLNLIEGTSKKGMSASSTITAAVLWRLFENYKPTLIIDEVDTIFGRNGSSSSHQTVRGVINAGHTRGGAVPRAVGSTDVKFFSVFGPMALGGLGKVPETIETRSVPIPMVKRKEGSRRVKPFRLRTAGERMNAVKGKLEAWSGIAFPKLLIAETELPFPDRRADVWEPLVAIGNLAGGDWQSRAWKACKAITDEQAKKQKTATGVQLLGDCRTVIGTRENMFTAELLTGLKGLPDTVWTDLESRKLWAWLAEFDVTSTTIRRGDQVAKGVRASAFAAAWKLYLPDVVPAVKTGV